MRSVESRHHRQLHRILDDTTGFVDLKMDPSNPEVLYAAGWHRIRWGGGRMEGAGAGRPREIDGPLSSDDLRDVLPGEYVVSLKVGDTTLKQSIVVEEGWVERMPGRIR